MTPPNLTQSADVALDPMAGTLLQTGRVVYSPDYQTDKGMAPQVMQQNGPDSFARAGTGNTMAEVVASLDPDPWARGGADTARPADESRAIAGSTLVPQPGVNVNILALDLGNKTGYAFRRRDGAMRYGTMNFTPRKNWTPGQRWARFRAWLSETIQVFKIDVVVFENVVFGHSSASASDVYGGFKAMVEWAADNHRLTLSSVAVPTVKKHFTGSGRADKDAMMAQAKARGFNPDSHNAADALAILHWAVEQERKA